ncbi:MAG: pyridoxamine 5'-phosphate oxidase family protein [Candidatus Thorarchaeota archaeon]
MKEYPESIGLDEIWEYFEGFPLAHLSTIDGEQPRVRPLSLIAYNDNLWMATKTEWNKVNQIKQNNNVEFTLAPLSDNGTGSIRVTAEAKIIDDKYTRQELSGKIPWFKQYWSGFNDLNFTLIQFNLSKILYDHPSDRKKYTVQLK